MSGKQERGANDTPYCQLPGRRFLLKSVPLFADCRRMYPTFFSPLNPVFRRAAVFLALLFCASVWAEEAAAPHNSELPPPLVAALQQAQLPLSNVAVVVHGLDDAQALLSFNSQEPMNPASTMKLLTTYLALQILGPQWKWRTGAYADQATNESFLTSPLYLKGSGDPKFALEHLSALLRQLRSKGIVELRGGIVLDREIFALPPFNPAAFDNLPMRPYNIGPDGLLMNFRTLSLTLRPHEAGDTSSSPRVEVTLETPLAGFSLNKQIRPGPGGCEDWKDLIRPQLRGTRGAWELLLEGTFNPKCGKKTLNLAALEDNDYAAALIGALWSELGGKLTGPVIPGTTPTEAVLLAENVSPPLAEIVRDINKFSNNVMARQLFVALSEQTPGTLEGAQTRVRGWLAANALDFPELVLDNGAGLSRLERINALHLASVLRHAWNSPVMPEFMSSLSLSGLDGTMTKRLREEPGKGRAHIKTGSLDGVNALAGYVLSRSGKRYAVVFLINGKRANQGQAAMDTLLQWLIESH